MSARVLVAVVIVVGLGRSTVAADGNDKLASPSAPQTAEREDAVEIQRHAVSDIGAAVGDLARDPVILEFGSAIPATDATVEWGRLSVEVPDDSCGALGGEPVIVLVTVSDLLEPINGVQVLIEYSEGLLEYVGITPGDGAGSPWDSAVEVYEGVGEQITYALVLLGEGSDEDAVVATIEFVALFDQTPSLAIVQLLAEVPPLQSKFTLASDGTTVTPDLQGPAIIARAGDRDADGDIDLADYGSFFSCLGGPGATDPLGPCCWFDFERDGDVDLADHAEFARVFTGP